MTWLTHSVYSAVKCPLKLLMDRSCIFFCHVFVFVFVLNFQILLAFQTPQEAQLHLLFLQCTDLSSSSLAAGVQINAKVVQAQSAKRNLPRFCIPQLLQLQLKKITNENMKYASGCFYCLFQVKEEVIFFLSKQETPPAHLNGLGRPNSFFCCFFFIKIL